MEDEELHEWEGYLPPEGTSCEGYIYAETASQGWPLNQWVPGVFVGRAYSSNGGVMGLLKTEDGRTHAIGAFSYFRPIRTPEQIEAEEREQAIEVIRELLSNVACDDFHAAVAIYDAGYRKQEPKPE